MRFKTRRHKKFHRSSITYRKKHLRHKRNKKGIWDNIKGAAGKAANAVKNAAGKAANAAGNAVNAVKDAAGKVKNDPSGALNAGKTAVG